MNSMNASVPLFLGLILVQCFAYNDNSIVNNKARKRIQTNPKDPRDLFASLYRYFSALMSGTSYIYFYFRYKKRLNIQKPQDGWPYFRPLFEKKSGIQDPLDPRNLFRAIYGYKR